MLKDSTLLKGMFDPFQVQCIDIYVIMLLFSIASLSP